MARFSASPTYVIVGRAEPAVPVAEVQSAAFTHPNEPSPNLQVDPSEYMVVTAQIAEESLLVAKHPP